MWWISHAQSTSKSGCRLRTFNTMRPRQNGCHFPDDSFKWIFSYKKNDLRYNFYWSLFPRIQLTIFHHCFRYLAWHRTCAKPMSEPMMVSLLTHICAIRSQWVKHDNRTNTWKILFLVNPVAINLDLNMIFVNSNVTKLPYINLHH